MAFPPSGRGKRHSARHFCLLAIAFYPYLSRKRLFQASPPIPPEVSFQVVLDDGFDPSRLRCVGSLAMSFPPWLSRKRLSQGSLGMLAIAFPPCLSRTMLFQSLLERPKSDPFRTILIASFGPSRWPFPPQREGKGKVQATSASSRVPFAPTCRGKLDFRPPLRSPPRGLFFRMILDAGCDPSRLPFLLSGRGKGRNASRFCLFAIAFSPSGRAKRPSRALPNPSPGNSRGSQKTSTRPSPELPRDGLYPSRSVLFPFPNGPFSSLFQAWCLPSLFVEPKGTLILCSPSSHVMCTCDGTNVIRVR